MLWRFVNEWRQSVCFSSFEVLYRRNDRNKRIAIAHKAALDCVGDIRRFTDVGVSFLEDYITKPDSTSNSSRTYTVYINNHIGSGARQ